ncbi:AMP-dependent synthetase [Azospirillum brasilense]|uniref:AMP-dependent synthetase n=1 Tax=Azospirillum brasilense TaxID=192 RepID=A0A0P0F9W6_AZOBR|nr:MULTISPECIES: acyl-CoA synthetase [Azospirillum]ALJ37741.1 AMP-dependent synthetase [Azospirillum brasilense]MDW7556494.1 acyl-CoA synthetase [Azospirillum brasilense]MDW7592596.1 acyl-CoA synthetase [Azospirillum brasilense]MDW7628126.1 acyl-CoA synthetase [Azospirillum brasilense]MDX5952064.1 acyl-CoA synthetase [Azospirillum brasilense]
MLPEADSYEGLRDRFVWSVPERYNIGVDVCDTWAERDPDRTALIHKRRDGAVETYSFADIRRLSNRLANALAAHGVARGDRVGILLPQAPETAVSHVAVYKMGGVAVPLFSLFGVEALEYRLGNCGARAVVTDALGAAKIAQIRDRLPELKLVLRIDEAGEGELDWHALVDAASEDFTPVDTAADDPAVIIYTSGTTGQPKGALHAHRVLLGHLPGVEISHDLFPQPGDRIWTPADWAWIGGLLDVLMPAWHHGVTVVSHRFEKFDAEEAFRLIADFQVRNAFLPPTALKMMRAVKDPQTRWAYSMRSVASGGETLGAELLDWGRQTFGLTINEFYGQTECNMIVSSCATVMPPKPGVMGRPAPGHDVAVIDGQGKRLPPGEIGLIAVRRPDPVMFLQYWNNPEATAAKFIGDWLVTGDQGELDADGYIRFVGRDDDVITSAGYRIGPGEIEDCLIGHPAVRMAAVVGVPDPLRTEIVKAFIVLQDGVRPSDALAAEIQAHVKTRLAAHEYPRAVEFVDSLPMTTTGKIIRRELRGRE